MKESSQRNPAQHLEAPPLKAHRFLWLQRQKESTYRVLVAKTYEAKRPQKNRSRGTKSQREVIQLKLVSTTKRLKRPPITRAT